MPRNNVAPVKCGRWCPAQTAAETGVGTRAEQACRRQQRRHLDAHAALALAPQLDEQQHAGAARVAHRNHPVQVRVLHLNWVFDYLLFVTDHSSNRCGRCPCSAPQPLIQVRCTQVGIRTRYYSSRITIQAACGRRPCGAPPRAGPSPAIARALIQLLRLREACSCGSVEPVLDCSLIQAHALAAAHNMRRGFQRRRAG